MKLTRPHPVTVLIALVIGLLALGALQAPADAATARTLSISASTSGVQVRGTVTFSGTLTKSPRGSAVTIQRKVGKKWVAAKSGKTTTAAGKYAIRVSVPATSGTSSYRAVAPAKGSLKSATSRALKVAALKPVTVTIKAANPPVVSAGASTVLAGTVKPFVANTVVTFQRFVNGTWLAAGFTTTVTSRGTFSTSVPVKISSVFRASLPRAGMNAPAVSFPAAVNANPVISSTSLPAGSQGAAYSAQLTQVGTNPGTWGVTSALPTGLTLNKTTGKITGTPSGVSNADYQFTFAQPNLVTAKKTLHLTISAPVPPTISTSSLPAGEQGTPYSTTLTAVGDPAGTWTAAPLPAGLSLNTATGVISGTPTAAATTQVVIGFTQANTGLPATGKTLPLVVSPPPPPPAPSIRTTTLPNAQAFASYSFTLTASEPGGTWKIKSGAPTGLAIDASTGEISGTPLLAGTYTTVVEYAVTGKPVASATYVWKVVSTSVTGTAIVSAGGSSTCRIDTDKSLACWGYDDAGQLGNGGTLDVDPAAQPVPQAVGTGTDWTAISVSADALTTEGHACGLRGTTAYCWGSDAHGMLGNGAGTVGAQTAPTTVTGSLAWRSISSGYTSTCGVTTSGKLYCWGDNSFGQLGTGGPSDQADPVQVGTATTWESVSTGYTTSCAVRTDGSLYCWGTGSRGQLGTGTRDDQLTPTRVGTASWSTVSVGAGHTCGRQSDGTVWCWGVAGNGRLGNGATLNDTSTDALAPVKVGTATTWLSVAAGGKHTCAVNQDGELWCWGSNEIRQLGDGTNTDRTAPTKIGTATDWQSVSAGDNHTCGTRTNGDVYCWGSNFKGKAGANASLFFVSTPTKV